MTGKRPVWDCGQWMRLVSMVAGIISRRTMCGKKFDSITVQYRAA